MNAFSIVIICKDAGAVIGDTLRSVQGLTDDVLLFDNGSTDETLTIAATYPVRVENGTWEGFGATKNKANTLAKYDWVLNLDADEAMDTELRQYLLHWQPEKKNIVFRARRRNFLGNRELRFGEWGRDRIIRMFNRTYTRWNDAQVHEMPEMYAGTEIREMPGTLLHRTMKDEQEYTAKTDHYAALSAEQYFNRGKKASALKEWFSPPFSFFRNYILRLGFLDGRAGFTCAKMTSRYTKLKYSGLRKLQRTNRLH